MLDDKFKQALIKKALGFDCDEIVEEYASDEKGNSVLVKRKITKKNNAPDIAALKFLFEQQNFESDEIANMTDEQLLQEQQRLLQLLKEKEKKDEN